MNIFRNIHHKDKGLYKLALFICFFLPIFFIILCSPATAQQNNCKIAIVKSWDLPEYNLALEGFFEVMTESGIRCEKAFFGRKGETEKAEEIAKEIKDFDPDMILTIGSRATSMISTRFEDIPVVFAMVLYPVASSFVESMDKPGKNVTGAAMDVPVALQLQELSRIVPKMKRVGVLFSPKETLPVIEKAKIIAQSMNLELLAEEVNSESDVPEALNKLDNNKIDALWSVADGNVFTRPSTRYIIKYVVRRGLPFMGPHNGFVKAGALFALTADYKDNGRQAAELSVRVINGEKPMNIPVAVPRKIEMALNLQVANHIRLRIPQEIIDEASQTFD